MLLIKTTDHMYYHTHVYDCGFVGYVYIKYNDGGFKVHTELDEFSTG